MQTDRRLALRALLGLGMTGLGPRPAFAQEGSLFAFADDRGRQVYNYRLPSDLSTEGLPGIVWTGAASPDVILVEFFDYNCPYCRAAASDLDGFVAGSSGLRLGLVNNPILNAGSVQAAKVQQAVLRLAGPSKAYECHKRILAGHRAVDGPSCLRTAGDLGLESKAIEAAADLPQVGDVLKRQAHLAATLGFLATPSFMSDWIGILGYPGPGAMERALLAIRRCDKLVCP